MGRNLLLLLLVAPACTDYADPEAPSVSLEVSQVDQSGWAPCKMNACELIGGRDRIRVVARYGQLDFDKNNLPPPPTLSIRLDGVVVEHAPAMVSIEGEDAELTFRSSTYRLPGAPATTLSVRVDGAPGFFKELGDFDVTPGKPSTVRVTGCGAPQCTSFSTGVGKARLAFDSWLDPDTKATLRSLVDGVPNATVEATFSGPLSSQRTASFELDVPRVAVTKNDPADWTLELAAEGLTIPDTPLTLVPPEEPTIEVTGCGEDSCDEFPASFGTAFVEVTSKLDAGTTLTLRSVVAGRALETVAETLVEETVGTHVARFEMAVPGVFVGVDKSVPWQLRLTGDGQQGATKTLHLVAPDFTAEFFECDGSDGCSLETGTALTLLVSAPEGFGERTVTARVVVDGVPNRDPIEVDLDTADGDRLFGYAAIEAPSEADQLLEAKVSFGSGYIQKATMTTVEPEGE